MLLHAFCSLCSVLQYKKNNWIVSLNPSRLDIHNRFTTMAKLEPFTHLENFRGKYSKTDKVYAKVRKVDDQMIGVRVKHPVTNEPPSQLQKAVHDKFKAVIQQVNTLLADTEQRNAEEKKWRKQRKYKSLRGFVFQRLFNEYEEGGQP